MARQSGGELVHERPAWILPVLAAFAVLVLSGVFLYYYFGPTPGEILGKDPRASAATLIRAIGCISTLTRPSVVATNT